MSFHESFWVVVGTAAPIIALAAVVSTSDAIAIKWRKHSTWHTFPMIPYYLGQMNVCLQFIVLLASLESLAQAKNAAPPSVAAWIAALGLPLLLATGMLNTAMRRRQEARATPIAGRNSA
jgi:hypothetical protein